MTRRSMKILVVIALSAASLLAQSPLTLWYRQPAKLWVEALPVGNGKLGAMIFGGMASERIQFNEQTVWTGAPHDYAHKGAYQSLDKLRDLLWAGKQKEAEDLAMKEFMSEPLHQKAYQAFGDLLLDFPGILTFRVIGEEVKDGRPAYLLAATPRPRVVPTTRAAKVLTGVEGKVWVDKETLHPIRIECTVVRPVPVCGMLASVLPGTEIEIVMTQVEPSIWLIDLVSMKLKVSEIHLFKSVSTTRTTYSHYRLNRPALDDLLSEAARQ